MNADIVLDEAAWAALYPERQEAHAEALLEGVEVAGRWCLDLEAGSGALSRVMRAAGARRVWAVAPRPAPRRGAQAGGAHRWLCGEARWAHRHPHLRVDGPERGFDVVACGSGVERLEGAGASPAELLEAWASLLAPGGVLVFDGPTSLPGEAPEPIPGAPQGRWQRVGDAIWSVRVAAGVRPHLERLGASLVGDWREALEMLTLTDIQADGLSGSRLRLRARRPSSTP